MSSAAHRTALSIVGIDTSVKGPFSMSIGTYAIFVPMEHDASYTLLFSYARIVADLLRGFVHEAWVREMDFTRLERVSGSCVSEALHDRADDMIWRMRWGVEWMYVALLLEFQATVDRYMAVRLSRFDGSTDHVSRTRGGMDATVASGRMARRPLKAARRACNRANCRRARAMG